MKDDLKPFQPEPQTCADLLTAEELTEIQEKVFERISPKKVRGLHHIAYVYYQNKYYEDADAIFRLLVQLDPKNTIYWKGLGACLQMKKNYGDASHCYLHVLELLADNPDAYLYVHLADCYFAMKQPSQGFAMLELARKRAKKVKDEKIVRHVSFMHERWKKTKKINVKL